jgi:putative FmdB family regulatory protein
VPIYEFECLDCGNPFETLIMGFSTHDVKCPKCDGEEIKKKISSFAVKGNGSNLSNSLNNAASCTTGST